MLRAGLMMLSAMALGGCVMIHDGEGKAARPAPALMPASPAGKTVLTPGNHFYSAAVRSGSTIYLAGVIGRSETGDIAEATTQAMNSVKTNIEAAGGTMADLVKCTVFLIDIAHYGAMNDVYASYFTAEPPARTALAVSALPFGALVEVECIAAAR